jgi:phage FluMu gp28-like protein
MKLTRRAAFLLDNLDLPAASGVEDARWEHFQLAHLCDDSTLRIENKSRQIAWSFTVAAEAIATAVDAGEGSIFVSINLEEAMEKIRYARRVYESLNISGLPRLVRNNELSLEFDNGARLLSLPSKPPRGKARMNVYLDEFAHVQHDREIYTAAIPVISKGGRLRIGSSPLGASGVYWELYTQTMRKYPGFTRKRTPWWEIQAFCRNVAEARVLAPALTSFQRVDMFGNDRIKAIYANMLEDDFQQEYEAEFVDETTAWISWETIQKNQDAELTWFHATNVDEALLMIPKIKDAIKAGKIELAFSGGIDVGRRKDLSEFMGTGITTTQQMPLRISISLDRVPFDDQRHCFEQYLTLLPFTNCLVDQNGIGMQLAENLAKTGKAQGVDFTNATKELWAVEAKLQAGRGNTPLPADRDLAYQIHSVKKKITASKNNVFDTEKNERHHADKFWAWALAISAHASAGAGWEDVKDLGSLEEDFESPFK